MSDDDKPKKAALPPIPPWAWIFAVVCIVIPIAALGGAIPGALGLGGAAACIGISRKAEKSEATRVIWCTVVSVGCWCTYIAVTLIVFAVSQPQGQVPGAHAGSRSSKGSGTFQPMPRVDLSDEDERRELYADAIRLRSRLEQTIVKRDVAFADGRSTRVLDKQVTHLEGMHDSHLEFMVSFHGITADELDEIIDEGDTSGWEE